MIVCVYVPRFELVVAAGDRSLDDLNRVVADRSVARQALAGKALALAPRVDSEQRVGEVSGAAQASGVTRGMMLGEALARCPDLILIPPDPVKAAERWEATMAALESIGAAVEPARPGLAYFETDPLRRLHGTDTATIAVAQGACRAALGGRSPRMGAGPTRFCALAAALATRSRRALVLEGPPARDARRWLAGQPVGLLGLREDTAALLEPLDRLGVRTLGELSRLGRAALSDRFGAAGALAHRLASGQDSALRPRRPQERLVESIEVGDASSGAALKRVLGVLVNRLLARSERRGRTLRAVVISARLVAGGGWRERVVFRQALCDPERIWLALSLRLQTLPAPADALRLSVEGFGPPAAEQGTLLDDEPAHPSARRTAQRAAHARLRGAMAQVRAVAGQDAVLRAVCVDPDSRVPERRVVLAPVPE
jgi:protein ImuB